MQGTYRRVLAALVVVLALLAASCGDDDSSGEAGDDSATTAAESTDTTDDATTTTAAEAADPPTLDVTAVDHAFELDQAELTSGALTVNLTNEGDEEHHATFVRFKEGKGPADMAVVEEDPSQLYDVVATFGGPNGVAPGATVTDTIELEAGPHAIVCFIPSPDDDVPHVAKGMITPIEVAEAEEPAPLPEADEAVGLADYSFDVPDDFDGSGTVEVTNNGDQPHELVAYEVAEGSTGQEVIDFFSTPPGEEPPPGPPPFTPAGGVAPMDQGTSNVLQADLGPGEYVFICFLPDAEDGMPHFLKGMATTVTIE